ncbi:hypothetical protein HYPSUDRAFT_201864 [Hypholoma sublateritium FD-334 SS-4]|uniref:Uncharacterized protein n=1 Tax=Hypholoma sublateritium (strain FD-334 SS-4) TaxID=945553 RepID=A0A0D2MGM4_HYPSF|nr:hypothetical protein HYPSUDRAFT_201864 [Hypholoma sublateritium FD-334 SS-4]
MFCSTSKAELFIVADRGTVIGGAAVKPETKSTFVSAILTDAPLPDLKPRPLVKGFVPALLYNLSLSTTRAFSSTSRREAEVGACICPLAHSPCPPSSAHVRWCTFSQKLLFAAFHGSTCPF